MGARTDAARQEALAARAGLADEADALKASARNAADVQAQVRRHPGRAAGVAAGTAFLAAGGPRRVIRAVKRRVVGEPEPLPASFLPKEIDRALRALGDDGGKVRGALERGFAEYLDSTAGARKAAARSQSLKRFALGIAAPVAKRAGQEALRRAFTPPDRPGDKGSAR